MEIVSRGTAKSIGAKAANLLMMAEAGLPVPDVLVVTVAAFEQPRFLAYLTEKEKELAAGRFDQLSSQLTERLLALVAEEGWLDLSSYLSADKTYAVRSSARAEDGALASFAGQFQTCLDVAPKDVLAALETCLRSCYSPGVLAYCQQQGIPLTELQMSLIIQEMVPSDWSGVYFTANPVGVLNEHLLVLGRGRGDGVVEDRVATTTVRILPQDQLMTYDGQVPEDLPSQQVLNQVVAYAQELTGLFGAALDIELAIVGTQIALLQVRPITTLPDGPVLVLDNSNIVESYPGVSTPLTISFVQEAYSRIFEGLVKRLSGQHQGLLTQMTPIFSQMVTTVNSHFYYQLHHWYHFLTFLPLSSRLIPIWQDMLGIEDLAVPPIDLRVSWWQRWRIAGRIVRSFLQSPRKMAELDANFHQLEQAFHDQLADASSLAELRRLYDDLSQAVFDQWDLTLINDLYAFVHVGLLKQYLPKARVQEVIGGIEAMASMKPARAMTQLLDLLEEDAASQAEFQRLCQLTDQQLQQSLDSPSSPLTKALSAYVQQFGDRAPEELKLETPTFRSHPTRLLQLLSAQLDQARRQLQPGAPDKVSGREAFWVTYLKKRAQLGIAYRESSRLNRSRLYGMVRTLADRVASLLLAEGVIDQREDVFYLTLEELFAGQGTATYRQLVKQRQKKYQQDAQQVLPRRLVFAGQVVERPAQQLAQEELVDVTTLQGIACSPGQVTGQVLRVSDIQAVQSAAGKILVTKMTDPGWVYVLMQARGIIAEQGSLLSHTAIISRELGIPAVVNVKQALAILRDGEEVSLDGTSGLIRRRRND